jgi:hypothetical protein
MTTKFVRTGDHIIVRDSRYPGVFVTRKKKASALVENPTNRNIPFSFADDISEIDWDKESAEYFQLHMERRSYSPTSELGSEQCLSSDTSCRRHPTMDDPSIACDIVAHECGQHRKPSNEDIDVVSRTKHRKSKDRAQEPNAAVDAVRYKTKLCKNWQQFEKCPYGPRCLFAHGAKEMRSYTVNHSAITTAASTGSPERQFYALGRFPSFMPVPFIPTLPNCTNDGLSCDEPCTASASNESDSQAIAVTSHSPYAFLPPSPEKLTEALTADCCDIVTPHATPSVLDYSFSSVYISPMLPQSPFTCFSPWVPPLCMFPGYLPNPYAFALPSPFLTPPNMFSMQVQSTCDPAFGMDMRATWC